MFFSCIITSKVYPKVQFSSTGFGVLNVWNNLHLEYVIIWSILMVLNPIIIVLLIPILSMAETVSIHNGEYEVQQPRSEASKTLTQTQSTVVVDQLTLIDSSSVSLLMQNHTLLQQFNDSSQLWPCVRPYLPGRCTTVDAGY